VNLLLGDKEAILSPNYVEEEEELVSESLGAHELTTSWVQNVVARETVNKAITLQKQCMKLLAVQAQLAQRGPSVAAGGPPATSLLLWGPHPPGLRLLSVPLSMGESLGTSGSSQGSKFH
jgi:hypothetical protein